MNENKEAMNVIYEDGEISSDDDDDNNNNKNNDCVVDEIAMNSENITIKATEKNVNVSQKEDIIADNIDGVNNVDDESQQPLLNITFRNQNVYNDIKDELMVCIRELFSRKMKPIDIMKNVERNWSLDIIENQNDSFIIDTIPTTVFNDVNHGNNENVPNYRTTFNCVINNENKESNSKDVCVRPKQKNVCFNCNGDHPLRNCTEQKDVNKISQNRKKFKTASERYHVNSDQRLTHLRPGIIGEKLQKALCLKKNEIPGYIYRMRVYGYPPGWLEDAKVSNSGLSLFDSRGKNVLRSDDEDTDIGRGNNKVKYDASKIISYPGFNVPPAKGTFDDSKFYRVPQMLEEHRKDVFIKSLKGVVVKGYKRKKLKNIPEIPSDLEPHEVIDMDIEEDDENLPKGAPPPLPEFYQPPQPPPLPPPSQLPPPPPPPPPKSSADDDEITLEQLHNKRMKIISDLNKNVSTNENTLDESLLNFILDNPTDNETSTISTCGGNTSVHIVENTCKTITVENEIRIAPAFKETIVGTPLLINVSPYSTTPSGEKWSVGVSDVIDFENLPDSTGTYLKMKKIIGKVRSIVKTLNED